MTAEETATKPKGERPMYVGWLEMEGKRYRLSLWKNKKGEDGA